MALPWLRIIDTALNVTDMVRRNRAARRNEPSRLTPGPLAALGGIVAGAAVVGWVGALVFALRSPLALGGRVTLAAGLALLIVGLACAVVEQAHQARSISAGDERLSVETLTAVGAAGLSSPWLVVAGYAAIAAAAIFG